MIRFRCQECGRLFALPDESEGGRLHCPICKTGWVVPPPNWPNTMRPHKPFRRPWLYIIYLGVWVALDFCLFLGRRMLGKTEEPFSYWPLQTLQTLCGVAGTAALILVIPPIYRVASSVVRKARWRKRKY